MTAHLSGDTIERYVSRSLPPADILALHAHLEMCGDCRLTVEEVSAARLPSALAPLLFENPFEPGDLHLTEEEMVAFVARRLPEPRHSEAARHITVCEACTDSVTAMESARNEPVAIPIRRRKISWYFAAGAIAASLLVAALVRYWPVHPAGTTPAAVSLLDGGQTIQLDSAGALRGLEGASPEERSLVRDTLKQGSLPAGPGLSAEPSGVLLTPDAASRAPFTLIGPIGTRVLSDRPLFTWQPYPGATAYEVLVTSEALDPLARSGRITALRWQPETPLPRGVTLLWQVRAWHGDEMVNAPAPPAPPARFQIAADRVAERLEQLRNSPHPSHLLAAVICARAGLRAEAGIELKLLARENPGSPLVDRLQGSPPVTANAVPNSTQ